ncbi:hypothetical protein [Paenibacillus alvei]|uniref:hypothetical protein n=1 Tax=Paenibacillus alvei TaxID=44250 RepID=UPI000386C9B6|nr:hypothetical protein [Paenibacillus alvei]EPY10920.1 hypothetical protein PAAL66ix_21757 [Paenibacillus alvei A6-6i-x]
MKRNILAAVLILGGSLLLGNTVYEGLAGAGETESGTASAHDMQQHHMEQSHMSDSHMNDSRMSESRMSESRMGNMNMNRDVSPRHGSGDSHMSKYSSNNDNCHNEA